VGANHTSSRRRMRSVLAAGLASLVTTLAFVAPADAAKPRPPLAPDTPVASSGQIGTINNAVPVTAERQHIGTGQTVKGAAATAPLAGGPGLGPESIVGPDNRYLVTATTTFPHSAVVQITRNGAAHCTGWLYGPDIVATAGHCVNAGAGGAWYTGLAVWPGRNGASTPYGSCLPTTLYSVVGWTVNGDERYDYGAMKLNCTIGNSTGWFGYFWQAASLNGNPSRICGYPGDKPNEQWCSDDQIHVSETEQLFYHNDTIGGHSGSPVYLDLAGCGVCSMAIHAYGFPHGGWPHNSYNHGTRITQPKFNNLWTWKYGTPPPA
jgi:glutamyl endopeptidase